MGDVRFVQVVVLTIVADNLWSIWKFSTSHIESST